MGDGVKAHGTLMAHTYFSLSKPHPNPPSSCCSCLSQAINHLKQSPLWLGVAHADRYTPSRGSYSNMYPYL